MSGHDGTKVRFWAIRPRVFLVTLNQQYSSKLSIYCLPRDTKINSPPLKIFEAPGILITGTSVLPFPGDMPTLTLVVECSRLFAAPLGFPYPPLKWWSPSQWCFPVLSYLVHKESNHTLFMGSGSPLAYVFLSASVERVFWPFLGKVVGGEWGRGTDFT